MGPKIQSVPLREKKCEFYLVLGPFLTGIGYIPDSITGRDRTVPKNFNHRRVRILLIILRATNYPGITLTPLPLSVFYFS